MKAKRFLAILVCALLVGSMLPADVLAADDMMVNTEVSEMNEVGDGTNVSPAQSAGNVSDTAAATQKELSGTDITQDTSVNSDAAAVSSAQPGLPAQTEADTSGATETMKPKADTTGTNGTVQPATDSTGATETVQPEADTSGNTGTEKPTTGGQVSENTSAEDAAGIQKETPGPSEADPKDKPKTDTKDKPETDLKDKPDQVQNYPAFSQSNTVNGVIVTVEAEAGVFPADSVLSVAAAPNVQVEAAIKEEREKNTNVASSYTFDIKVLGTDGNEIQPAEGQSVKVSFRMAEVADENLETQVWHIEEDETDGSMNAEPLETISTGDTVMAEADGFSYYTVEFTYGKLQYVLPGDDSIPLSTILDKVGLKGIATAVSVSNEELFSASNESGEWIITSHKAFTTTEKMTVTIAEIEYEITVTDAESIRYLDINGDLKTISEYTKVGSDTNWRGTNVWYVVTGDITINDLVTVSGIVNLILEDGATLTVRDGIKVDGSNSLTIYAQSTGGNIGRLVTLGEKNFQAGIGGGDYEYTNRHCGTIVINGGNIDATGGKNGAGIGGGWNGDGGNITINGGVIRAKGGALAAGIGGGRYGNGGTINITGGTITRAEAGDKDGDNSCGAGIGGGQGQEDGDYGGGYGGTINISGGVIEYAKGGYSGAGIGGGVWGDGGKITISGDAVINNAQGGKNGAGIGGGYKGKGGTITISGGLIENSIAGERAAGIGGGYLGDGGNITLQGDSRILYVSGGMDKDKEGDYYAGGAGIGGGGKGDSGNITIKGNAYIKSTQGRNNGAGIGGGGYNGNGNTISIEENALIEQAHGSAGGAGIGSGGYKVLNTSVSLTAGTINISGGKVIAFGGTYGTGIGGGFRSKGETITISGGEVHASAGYGGDGAGIGSGPDWARNAEDNTAVIKITGGTVIASGGKGAGIGGGSYRSAKVVISGGNVKASSSQGAGIGGGIHRNGGTIEISGGAVVESGGGSGGAGIGGGSGDDEETGGAGGTITISGKDTMVTASGKDFGAGIGGGSYRPGGTITINDGTVTAQGGTWAAGIGGGANLDSHGADARGHAGTITINGGMVKAFGGPGGAGIGGGGGVNNNQTTTALGGNGGKITINGGTVEATGEAGGAGIGGGGGIKLEGTLPGLGGSGGTIKITGGNITATGKLSYYKYKDNPTAFTSGAGIGGGSGGDGGTIDIRGGTINAGTPPHEQAEHADHENESAAIGGGQGAACGSIKISGGKVVANGEGVGIGCGVNGSGGDGLTLTYSDSTKAGMSVNVSSYNCSAKTESGKPFIDGYGGTYQDELSDNDKSTIAGRTIFPGSNGAVYLDLGGNIAGPVPCTPIDNTTIELNGQNETDGWYMITKEWTLYRPSGIPVEGNVNLILCDAASLEIISAQEGSLLMEEGSSLTVWAQSAGENMGKLTLQGTDQSMAIKGYRTQNMPIQGDPYSLTVNGGTLTAQSEHKQGMWLPGGSMTVNRGSVFAEGTTGIFTGSLTVNSGSCSAVGKTQNAIEIQNDTNDVSLNVFGGSLTANGADLPYCYGIYISNNSQNGRARACFSDGTTEASGGEAAMSFNSLAPPEVEITNMAVYSSKEDGDEPVEASQREDALQNSKYAKVIPCTHGTMTYTDNGLGQHNISCKFCDKNYGSEDHSYTNHVCVCGLEQPSHKITFYANNKTKEYTEQIVYEDEKPVLDENSFSWERHTFNGWNTVQNPSDTDPGTSYADGAEVTLAGDLELYAQWTPVKTKLTITASDQEYPYTGNVQGEGDTAYEDPDEIAEKVKVKGLLEGDSLSSIILDGQAIEVGEHQGEIKVSNAVISGKSGDMTEYYDIEYVPGTLTIYSGEMTIRVDGSSSPGVTYDGNEQEYEGTVTASCDAMDFDSTKFSYTGSTVVKGTDANSYKTVLEEQYCTYADPRVTVYWEIGDPVELTVNQREITIGVEDTELDYNGSEQQGGTTWTFDNLVGGHHGGVSGDCYTPPSGKEVNTYDNGSFGDMTAGVSWWIEDIDDNDQTDNYTLKEAVPGKLTVIPGSWRYTVKYLLDGKEEESVTTEVEVSTLSDAVIQPGTLVEKKYPGYKLKEVVPSGIKEGDRFNDLDVIRYLYETAAHKVNYVYTGDVPAGATPPAAGEYKYGDTVPAAAAPAAVEGYTFEGWDTPGAFPMPDSDVTVTGTWSINKYNVTFMDYDGKTVLKEAAAYVYGTPKDEIVKPEDPVRKSDAEYTYTFAGWTPKISDVTADAVYKATYKAVPVPKPVEKGILTFDLSGGTLNGKTGKITIEAKVGDIITIPQAPTRSGYTFLYWYGSEYHPGDKYTVKGNHTFKALWKKTESSNNNTNTWNKSSKSPRTDDSSHAEIWLVLMAVSLLGLILIAMKRKGLR